MDAFESALKAHENIGIPVLKDVPLSRYASFRTGGNASLLISPSHRDQLIASLAILDENGIDHMIIGRGSNLLISDEGYKGAVIRLAENYSGITVDNDHLVALSGTKLSSLCLAAHEHSLSGAEFAGGIPGSVGGALVMNAGAYGGEIKDILCSAEVLLPDMTVRSIPKEECELSYRNSIFRKSGYTVISATFRLNRCSEEELLAAKEYLHDLNLRRKKSQPLEYPSAGSTFKRPEGHYAAALIDQCGLKGLRVGGACVSEKHAGFIINDNNATSSDIYLLINKVRQIVFEKTQVVLEPEVIFIGKFQ